MDIQSLATNTMFAGIAQRGTVDQAVSDRAAAKGVGTPSHSLSPDVAKRSATNETSRDQLEMAVKATQDFVGSINSSLEFSIDEDTGTSIVKIVDKETEEVIRQIPSEEMLSIAKALDTIKGLLFHQKA